MATYLSLVPQILPFRPASIPQEHRDGVRTLMGSSLEPGARWGSRRGVLPSELRYPAVEHECVLPLAQLPVAVTRTGRSLGKRSGLVSVSKPPLGKVERQSCNSSSQAETSAGCRTGGSLVVSGV